MLPRCCSSLSLSLLCPPTGHDPRHLFVPAPTVRSLGNNYGPHLMTSGMPRAVVVVSSAISLFFGLLSRNYNPREIHGYTTHGSGITNYIPVHACTHTMHTLRLSRPRAGFLLTIQICCTSIRLRRFYIHITRITLDAGLPRTLHTRTRHLDTQTLTLSRRPSSPHDTHPAIS